MKSWHDKILADHIAKIRVSKNKPYDIIELPGHKGWFIQTGGKVFQRYYNLKNALQYALIISIVATLTFVCATYYYNSFQSLEAMFAIEHSISVNGLYIDIPKPTPYIYITMVFSLIVFVLACLQDLAFQAGIKEVKE